MTPRRNGDVRSVAATAGSVKKSSSGQTSQSSGSNIHAVGYNRQTDQVQGQSYSLDRYLGDYQRTEMLRVQYPEGHNSSNRPAAKLVSPAGASAKKRA